MTRCVFCRKDIGLGTPAVSIVGGMFPKEEPDLFMIDEQVLRESHAHLDCLIARVSTNPQQGDIG